MLLAAGADPNFVDTEGDTPLILCALYNSLTDEQSRDLTQLLLNATANPAHVSARGYTAKQYAEMAEKKLTAAIL
jgi:ankyrin repeat protein